MKKKLAQFDPAQISQLLFLATVFVLPLGWQSLVWDSSAWGLGVFDFYAAFFLHVSELLFLASFVLLGFAFFQSKTPRVDLVPLRRFGLPILLILAVAAGGVLVSPDPVLSLLSLWRVLILAGAASLLAITFIPRDLFVRVFASSLAVQSVIAIGQFFLGQDLGLQLLGESSFTAETLNIAKIELVNGTVVRGLGTLAHANLLGGLLTIGLLLLAGVPHKRASDYALGLVMLGGVFFTFSRAAWLALALGLLLLLIFEFRQRLVSILVTAVIFMLLTGVFWSVLSPRIALENAGQAATGRWIQIEQAVELIQTNPLGVGRGQYTTALAELEPSLADWQLQPVHHFFLLRAVEESVLAALTWLGLFIALAWRAVASRQFTALAVVAALFMLAQFDHYLATSIAGAAILWLALGWVLAVLGGGFQVRGR